MDFEVTVAMLASALLHACWNAWVKSKPDPRSAIIALAIGAGVPQALVLVLNGLPPTEAWVWIACSVSMTVVAQHLLAAAYRHGDFAVAYPMTRALIPVLLTLLAIPLFDEHPSSQRTIGVACVSAALGLITWESARRSHTMTSKGLAFSALAAAVTSCAVMLDAKGTRLANNPLSYAAMISVLNATSLLGIESRRANVLAILKKNWAIAIFGSTISNVSYVLYVWSLKRAPLALVVPLRETSMLFAMVIAWLILRERIGPWRLVAVAIMVAGVVLIHAS